MLAGLAMTPPPDSPDAGRGQPATGTDGSPSDIMAQRALKPRFSFDVTKGPGATMITLAGELDVVCADVFRRKFTDATQDEPGRVVMDLRDLTFLDSTGLALLLRVNEMSRDLGFVLSIVSREEDPASKIFRMTGTNAILPVVADPPDLGSHA
jgi:anti-sigma B factor antagonist